MSFQILVPSTAVTPRAPVLPTIRDIDDENIEIEINYPYSTYVRAGEVSKENPYSEIVSIAYYNTLNSFLEGNISSAQYEII